MNVSSLPPALALSKAEQLHAASEESDARDAQMREKAKEFESIFIAEMLSHVGFDKALSENAGFGGEAFSRMLVETYAEQLSEKGGFGLADQIYRQLKGEIS
ncbi:rod-binding protein [Hyphococcus sp.]|uniref:rod-binding protein n=1 Tax=Hyphococcus sp. TaxID=2038636 RepID=UPI003CCB99DE